MEKNKKKYKEITHGVTIKKNHMRRIPTGFENRPKPDMCIISKKEGVRKKFIIWDWKSPTEGH